MPRKVTDPAKAKTTIDHAAIREWAEERDGHPARVKGRIGRGGGILRIDFGDPEESLEIIPWDEFFDVFEKNGLAFLHQDKIDGKTSRFFKFVRREGHVSRAEMEEE